jgi:DNA-binding protein YbaB
VFDKLKQLAELKKIRDQAMNLQRQLAAETFTLEEKGVRVVLSGDQKIQLLEIDGVQEERIKEILNKALKKSQEMAAKKLQSLSGGLPGMLGKMMG